MCSIRHQETLLLADRIRQFAGTSTPCRPSQNSNKVQNSDIPPASTTTRSGLVCGRCMCVVWHIHIRVCITNRRIVTHRRTARLIHVHTTHITTRSRSARRGGAWAASGRSSLARGKTYGRLNFCCATHNATWTTSRNWSGGCSSGFNIKIYFSSNERASNSPP